MIPNIHMFVCVFNEPDKEELVKRGYDEVFYDEKSGIFWLMLDKDEDVDISDITHISTNWLPF